jgi:hypothetical protein
LRFKPKPGTALLVGADAVVGDEPPPLRCHVRVLSRHIRTILCPSSEL